MCHTFVRLAGILMIITIFSGLLGRPAEAEPFHFSKLDQTIKTGYVPGQLIVKFKPYVANLLKAQLGSQASGKPDFRILPPLDQLSRRYELINATPAFNYPLSTAATQPYGLSQIYILTVPLNTDIWHMAADYNASLYVIYAEPNYIAWTPDVVNTSAERSSDLPGIATIFPNDPAFSVQYGLHNTGQFGGVPDADVDAPEAWQIQTGDPAVMVAILDTGVDYNHPDLAGKVRTDIDFDFVDLDNAALDTANHGTRVAGVAAASANNSIGIAGMCWDCQILPVRVGTSVIHFTSLTVAQGIIYATLMGADVINMSLGGQCSDLWADAVNFAYDNDVVLLAAAGNVVDFVVYPALFKRVMAISATDRNDMFASFSSFGPTIDVAAPGTDMQVTDIAGGVGTGSGTSYATALTSGLVGLLRSENPALTNAQVRQILWHTAEDLGPPGFDQFFGHGRVNAHHALSLASTPPSVVYWPASDVCGCLLSQTAANTARISQSQGPNLQENGLTLFYRLRDEVLANTPLGEQITDNYYRHSAQVTNLLIRDETFRNQMLNLLEAGFPYLVSLLEEDGQKRLDEAHIDQANDFIKELADRANPELRGDLLQTWQALALNLYAGRPVKDALRALAQRPKYEIFLPIITK